MKLKNFIEKFANKELETGDEFENFYFSKGVLYYVVAGIKLYLATHRDDHVVIRWRQDVKGGLKKLLRFMDKDIKVLLVTREIEYTKDIEDLDHEISMMNIIYYFAQGRWLDFFIKNKLDIYKYIFSYVDRFDCLDEFKEAVRKTTNDDGWRSGTRYAFYDKNIRIGPWWDDEYGELDNRYKEKFVYIYRQYKLYQIMGY